MTGNGGSTRLLTVLRRIAEALDGHRQPWALVGGLAVSVRCEPRFTRDIDVAAAVKDDAGAAALVSRLVASGFRLRLSLEHEALRRLATVRLTPPGEPEEGIVVDLLFASSGIESEICRDADRLKLAPGLTVPVARAGHLVAMKLLALAPDRPQDAIDLHALIATLTEADRAHARLATARIVTLGANRSKPLREELERWLGGATPCP
ncbi:MAG TPA: nucleotidyl transferase AbiEii/AbiGii toxin family protein [Vicinamibacterales bacterium]|nr:nucleotidyl transferase AbiEii/AbiGii toxin family protein [Vicinamibacterales bacterium]